MGMWEHMVSEIDDLLDSLAEETPRQAAFRRANHLSGCGEDISKLEERILHYLQSHGRVDDWHALFDVFDDSKVAAWRKWGKRSAEILLKVMIDEGAIE